MADKKNFSLIGIGANVQYGKSGGRIKFSVDHMEARNAADSGFIDVYVPLTPGDNQAAASKSYVDEFTTTLIDAKNSVRVATTADGPFTTAYDNGSSIDAIVLATGNRILIKDQSDGTENGIYIVQGSGAPVRAPDANTDAEMTQGAFCFTIEGTQNGLKTFVLITPDAITLDVTAQVWAETQPAATVVIDAKDSVRVATTTNGTFTTAFANSQTIDAVVINTGDRILLKNQTAPAENGLYVVNVSGSPTRTSDANTDAKVTQGAFCFVAEGTANAKKNFLLTTADPIIVDTTGQVWEEVGGGGGGGNSFGIVTGDSGTATADVATDTLQLQGATSGGITTTGSDAPELITFGLTPIDLATTGATMASGDFIIVSDSADAATVLGQKITFANAFNDLGVPFTGGTLDLADYLPLAGGTLTGALVADDAGSASLPDIAWTGDLDTGFAQIGAANTLSIISGGARVAEFDGTVTTPINYFTFASSAAANPLIITNAGTDTNGIGLGITILGKTASAAGDGGPIIITGGVGNDTGTGGAITFTGGDSAGASGTAGSVTIDAGAPAGGGGGAVTIAGTDATTLILGSTSFPIGTTAIGILALTAADTLTAVNATTGGSTQQLLQFDDSGDTFSWIDKASVGGSGATDELDIKLSVRVATTANISLTGEQTIDDISTSTDRILVKNQSAGAENGIYVTAAGAWSRATDSNADAEVTQGSVCFVVEGTANEKTSFILVTVDPITVGSTAQVWESAGGGGGGATVIDDLTDVDTTTIPPGQGQTLGWDGANWTPASANALEVGQFDLLHVVQEEALAVNGGTASATTWNLRTLNTIRTNEIAGASLGSNQITLLAGTYEVFASAPAYFIKFHKLRLRNVTDSTTTLVGTSAFAQNNAASSQTRSFLSGRFTITAQKIFELEHWTELGLTTTGLGNATNEVEVEIFADIQIRRVTPVQTVAGLPFKGALVKLAADIISHTPLDPIPFDAEEYDIGGWHDNSTNNTRLTVPTGITKVKLWAEWVTVANENTTVNFFIRKNGSDFFGMGQDLFNSSIQRAGTLSSAILEVVAGDYFEFIVDIGAAFDLESDKTAFSIEAIEATAPSAKPRGALVNLAADELTADFSPPRAINFDAETYDTDSIHDNSTNNTRLTVPSGVTHVKLTGHLFATSVGTAEYTTLFITKNGSSDFIGTASSRAEVGSTNDRLNVSTAVVEVISGDYFELVYANEIGSSITIESEQTSFSMEIIEPAVIAGLPIDEQSIKESVVCATDSALILASDFEAGDSVDGVTLALADRILIKDQSAGAENGIYVVTTGTPLRANDANTTAKLQQGSVVFVSEGTVNGATSWLLDTDNPIILDTTSQNWASAGGGGGASTFISLTDTPSTFTGQSEKIAQVNTNETALEFVTFTTSSFTDATIQTTDATKVNIATGALVSGEVATILALGQAIEISSGDVYWFEISGAVKNIGGTTSLVGTPKITEDSDAGAASWSTGLEEDDAGDNWELTVTGEASKTIVWLASFKEVKQLAISDPDFASVVLLAGFDGADGATAFSDESPAAHGAFTFVNQAQLDTAQKKFGTASLLLDGDNDKLLLADHADWNFGDGKFTIEGFFRINNLLSSVNMEMVTQWPGGSQKGWVLGADRSGSKIRFIYSTTGSNAIAIEGDFTWAADTWYHLAADRDASNDIRVYVDGVVKAGPTAAAVTFWDSTSNLAVGDIDAASDSDVDGWIDELRITKGVARYAGAFTPPTTKFPRG